MRDLKVIYYKLFEIFIKNWKVKLGSIFLATIFYINLQNSKILIKNINIPIDYPKLELGKYYTQEPPKNFPVRVEGLREVVNYYSQFMKAVPDFSDIKVGENIVAIKTITGAPSGIKVTKLRQNITFVIEGQQNKQVPVEVTFEGELPPNYEKISYGVSPNRLTIAGRQSDIDKINKISLPSISLQDVTESFVKKLKVPDLIRGVYVTGGIKQISVNVVISPQEIKAGEQIITGIPLRCVGAHPNLVPELSLEQVSVKIQSKLPIRSSSIINGIQATVACNHSIDMEKKKIIPNDQPVSLKIRVSRSRELKNIEILQVIPDKVTVQYRIKSDLKLDPLNDEIPDSDENIQPPLEDRDLNKGFE